MAAWFGALANVEARTLAAGEVRAWGSEGRTHDGEGSMFFVATEAAMLVASFGTLSVPANGYGLVVEAAELHGGRGLSITARTHRGLFCLGGPVEGHGRLRYIDGCSDTVLVPPVVRGDPCLNLLCIPAGVVQTDHDHPSVRVGLILDGAGRCVLAGGRVEPLDSGVVFVLEAGTTHRFETGDQPMRLVAWHPDSDFGPTDDDHPMLNRTLRPRTATRVR